MHKQLLKETCQDVLMKLELSLGVNEPLRPEGVSIWAKGPLGHVNGTMVSIHLQYSN